MNANALIAGLMQRGLPLHVAQGIVANMKAESRLDPGINEIAPIVPGSRGGFGLNQWTGPRRVQFEEYAAARGADPADVNTQLDFTLWELNNTESRAHDNLLATDNAIDAARVYSDDFLRPGIPHMDRRLSYAREFAGEAPESPRNALAGFQQGMDRMQQFNALAAMPKYEAPQLTAFQIGTV